MSEQLILVDREDKEVGTAEKLKVHQEALMHRAFSVFVFRSKANQTLELLLQQRQHDKYHCGGLWTNTCCGHPRPGETIIAAGQRRLFEEMGIAVQLNHWGTFHYIAEFKNGLVENEVDHVLAGWYHDESVQPSAEEVSQYSWVKLSLLKQDLKQRPEVYTPWFKQALAIAEKASKGKVKT